jgi:hypothetical protein
MNALALARTYGIDAELLSGMDDASISSWNAKRRDVSGIRPDLHESLRDAAPEEITQRIADLDAGQIPQNLLNQYTKKATEKFLELQSTGAGMSPQDMANVAHNHALSSMREAVRPRSREEMLQKLRKSEQPLSEDAIPPVNMRLTPKQFAGLTEEAISQAMEAEGLEVTPTTSEASLSEMMYKKGRSPKSGEDTRPLYARDYPELDISGLAPDLQKRLRSGDPDEVSKAIDEVTKRMGEAEALGISVPELLGQTEKTSITGYATGDLKRIPSKHYIKDPHTGALTPHGITTGGVGQYDIDALNQMGRVDVLSEDDPSRIHKDKSGQNHVMTHVFTPDPRKVTLIPSGKGNLVIQRHVTQSAESHRRRPDLPTSVGAHLEEHQADVEAMMHVEDYSGSAKKDTRAAAAANIPGSALEQRKASNKAMRLDERAQELIESDVASQDEVDRALFEERQSAAAESGQVIGGQFKSVATRMPISEARQRVMSDIFAKDDIKEQAKRQDPVYQQDMADYQAEMAKRRENPLVSGIESLRDTSASVSQKAVRLADEASNLITRGIPRDQVINFLSTAHESSPIFNDVSEEHHSLIKGMAIHKLNEVHNLGIRGAELSGMNLSNADVSPARGANEVFDVLRSRLPEDHPMKTAIGSNASGTRGQVIDQNLLIPSFEDWRKPKLQTRSMERAVAGMFRGGPVEPKVAPKVNEAELNRRSEESRAEANRLIAAIPPPGSMGSAMTNLPPQRGGSAFQPASSFAPGTPLMEVSIPSRTSVNRGMPMDSAALRGEISQASSTHRGMIANAIQARSNMAKFNDNMRQHQSMLARADEFDRRASSTPNPKLAAQHKSEAGNIRAQAEAHFKATGLHMSPEEHRSNFESMKSQAIEHSRNEGLTARGYAQSSGEAEFFFR